jgi:hypothetical protein
MAYWGVSQATKAQYDAVGLHARLDHACVAYQPFIPAVTSNMLIPKTKRQVPAWIL